MKQLERVWIIRCSDGWIASCLGEYNAALQMALDHIDGREEISILIID